MKNVVGHRKGVGEGCLLIGNPEQVLVGNHDQGIDKLLHFFDTGIGDSHSVRSFELEWLGNNADGQHALLAGKPGNDRCGSGSCAATHTGGNKHHVRSVQDLANVFHGFFCRGATHIGPGTRP